MTDIIFYAGFTAVFLILLHKIWQHRRGILICSAAVVIAANADGALTALEPWRDMVLWHIGDHAPAFLLGFGGAAVFGVLFWRTAKRNIIWQMYREDEESARRKRNARLEQV